MSAKRIAELKAKLAEKEAKLAETEARLAKCEATCHKQRTALSLFKEKALNIGELVRQHQQLQQQYEEAQQAAAAAGEAQQALQAKFERVQQDAKRATAASTKGNRERRQAEEAVEGLTQRVAAAEQAAVQAQVAAAAAAQTGEQASGQLAAVAGQLVELKRQIDDAGAGPLSTAGHGPTSSNTVTAQLARLSKEVAALQQENVVLQTRVGQVEPRGQGDGMQAALGALALKRQVSELAQQQTATAQEMKRWRAMLGGLPWSATEAACQPKEVCAAQPLLPAAARPAEPMDSGHGASCGTHNAVPPAEEGSADGPAGQKSNHLQRQGSSRAAEHDKAAAQAVAQQPSASGQGSRPKLESEEHHGDSYAAATSDEFGSPEYFDRLDPRHPAHHTLQQQRRQPSLDRTHDTNASLAGAVGPDATAADLVQAQLGRLTRQGGLLTRDLAQQVAAQLADLITGGACPLESVLAGVETAILDCAGPDDQPQAPPGACSDAGGGDQRCLPEALGGHIAVQDMWMVRVWGGREMDAAAAFAGLMLCASLLHGQLQGDAAEGAVDLLGLLRAHLHAAAIVAAQQQPPTTSCTELCALSAAAATLARMTGSLQAMRVLVCDTLAAVKHEQQAVLPRLTAALDAWPAAVPPPQAAPQAAPHGDETPPLQLIHASLQRLCQMALRDQGTTHDGSTQSTTKISAQRLLQLGNSWWGWNLASDGVQAMAMMPPVAANS